MITVTISVDGEPVLARSAGHVSEFDGIGTYKLDDGRLIVHDIKQGIVSLAMAMLKKTKEPGEIPAEAAMPDLSLAISQAISRLVAGEYDDGSHPLVAGVINDLRAALDPEKAEEFP